MSKKYDKILSKEKLYKEYIFNKKSIYKISKELKLHQSLISRRLKKEGFIIRKPNYSFKTKKQYYCIEENCNNIIGVTTALYSSGRCKKCKHKRHSIIMSGNRSNFYIDGRKNKKYTCSVKGCKNNICYTNFMIGSKKCRKHSKIGKRHSKKTLRKMSLARGGSGISRKLSKYGIKWNNKLREQIRKRDNYICQLCGKLEEKNGRKLDVHHIDYNKKNCSERNLISLCRKCHLQTNLNKNIYQEFFEILIDSKKGVENEKIQFNMSN